MIFDGHSDIWTDVTVRRCNGEKNVFDRLHYPRMHKGGVEGSIFVIWLDPPFDADPDKRLGEILTAIREDAAESRHLRIVRNMAEAEQALRDGKFYTFIGIEGLDVIGDDLDKLDMLYDFGARHADLTWNGANAFGTGLRGDPDRGLTELGKKAVRKIQEKGMILDTCHNNDKTFWDIMDVAVGPVIASHSDCRDMCNVPRNLTDDMLRALRSTDGFAAVNSYGEFAHIEPAKRTVDELARHVAHMVEIMDIDHVGLGFDFIEFFGTEALNACSFVDGADAQLLSPTPSVIGMRDASEIPNFLEALKRVGFNEGEVKKLARDNWLNFIRRVVG